MNARRGAVFNFPSSSLVIITLEHNNIHYLYSRDHTSPGCRHKRPLSYTRIPYIHIRMKIIFLSTPRRQTSFARPFRQHIRALFADSPHYTFTRVALFLLFLLVVAYFLRVDNFHFSFSKKKAYTRIPLAVRHF